MGESEKESGDGATGEKDKDAPESKREGQSKGGDDSERKDAKDDQGKESKSDDSKPKKPPIYKKPAFIITASVVFVVLIVGGIVFWLIARHYVSTDDAYVDGHVIQISPQVAAQVTALHITDNQLMHQGDLLMELDPTDYQVALQQARAQTAEARGRVEQSRAQIESAQAAVPESLADEHAAQAAADNAASDLERYRQVDARARSKQQLDNAGTALTNALAKLEQVRARVVSARANVTTAEAAAKVAEDQVRTAEANEKRAEVNLSYCQIRAPAEGRVTQRTVETGNYVVAGQALFLLVDPNVWVTANFKETQLTHIQPGQVVTIKVDAFPDLKLHGHVDSIQAGSGSRFSVLPAENATGNYVKIVQRVPVKILFDHDANTNNAPMLSPGLSVIPRVTIR